uniref:Tartrate-resistant acid phosphatase type 5 n=1 Tax=Panagrolaimus sp. PS1159 TaxID=55785 RepID=A0AC35GQF9_9BILA
MGLLKHLIFYFIHFIFFVKPILCVENTKNLENRLSCTSENGCSTSDNYIDFFLLGDTGGLPPPFYTSYAQKKVAEVVAKISTKSNSTKFILGLGDNFYFSGVNNVEDRRFLKSFEIPYKDLSLPWYMIAGNHDHLGNISAQIFYTNHSNFWTFPNQFYSIKYKFGNSSLLQILMIDTIELCGIDIADSTLLSVIWHKKVIPDHPANITAAEIQWKWIEKELSESKADYLFVSGHYPIYSISDHGPNQCLINRLDPLLRKYNVTAYFSGHDHNLQSILYSNKTDQSSLMYIVSGAGSRSDQSQKHLNSIPKDSLLFSYPEGGWNPFALIGFSNGGFVQVSVGPKSGNYSFYCGSDKTSVVQTFFPRKPKTIKL